MTVRYKQETTEWPDAPNTPNHIYITDGRTLIGYIPVGGKEIRFKKPYRQWSPSRRTFRELKPQEIQQLS